MDIDEVDLEEENEDEDLEWIEDVKNGGMLDPGLVREARQEEVGFMAKIGLYDIVPEEESWEQTGKGPISTKWVDVNKGTKEKPDVRCRLVARDFKPKYEKDRADLFAAMPPLEALKTLMQKAVDNDEVCRRKGNEEMKLLVIDVKKAHLNAYLKEGEKV